VAVDVGNGAGGVTVDALGALGCPVETLNARPDGSFPARASEPEASTLGSLCALVGGSEAALGIAHDGDADRTMAVDETGAFVPKDALLAVLAGASAGPGDRVAVPVDTSLAVADYLAQRDVRVERTPVGDVHVAAAVAGGCAFGGEPSGAWIWPGVGCPDATLAACRLAALVADRPLAERVRDVPDYPIRRESVAADRKAAVVDAVRERVEASYGDVETLDGVRVDLDDAWFLVRASGTQPLVRVTAEAREPDRADAVLSEARELVAAATD
jgi:phosphoglucosamine mutase